MHKKFTLVFVISLLLVIVFVLNGCVTTNENRLENVQEKAIDNIGGNDSVNDEAEIIRKPYDIKELHDLLRNKGFGFDSNNGNHIYNYNSENVDHFRANNGYSRITFYTIGGNDVYLDEAIAEFDEWYSLVSQSISEDKSGKYEEITMKWDYDYVCMELLYEDEYSFFARIDNTVITCRCNKDYMTDLQLLMTEIGYK